MGTEIVVRQGALIPAKSGRGSSYRFRGGEGAATPLLCLRTVAAVRAEMARQYREHSYGNIQEEALGARLFTLRAIADTIRLENLEKKLRAIR
jgi:hypothetical protein